MSGALPKYICTFLLLFWRAWVLPADHLWRDLIAIVAAYFVLRFALRDRYASLLTVATVTMLLGIYVFGQFPYTLMTLGFGR
jgi:hypothetical protein